MCRFACLFEFRQYPSSKADNEVKKETNATGSHYLHDLLDECASLRPVSFHHVE